MGVRRQGEYSESSILSILNRKFLFSPMWVMNNLHVYNWESDYLAVTKSWYTYEIEVKISEADYKQDFKKEKHKLLSKGLNCPNYFYFACPTNVIQEVPDYAGLIYVQGKSLIVVKTAPILHKVKFDYVKYRMTDKFYYNMQTWKERAKAVDDPKPRIRRAVQAVRDSATEAWTKLCEHTIYPFGPHSPMCELKEKGIKDCLLQCEKGREFKKMLK